MSFDVQAAVIDNMRIALKPILKGWQVYPMLCRALARPRINHNSYSGIYGFSAQCGGIIFVPHKQHVSPIEHYNIQIDEILKSDTTGRHTVLYCKCPKHSPLILNVIFEGSAKGYIEIYFLSRPTASTMDFLYGKKTRFSGMPEQIRPPESLETIWPISQLIVLSKLPTHKKMVRVHIDFYLSDNRSIEAAIKLCGNIILSSIKKNTKVFPATYDKDRVRLLKVPAEWVYSTVDTK